MMCALPSSLRPRGFTLIELLVVIGIISILISLLLPALFRAREAVHRVSCMSNQRQIFVAASNYMSDNRGWAPPGAMLGRGEIRFGQTPPNDWALNEVWWSKYVGKQLETPPGWPATFKFFDSSRGILWCPSGQRAQDQWDNPWSWRNHTDYVLFGIGSNVGGRPAAFGAGEYTTWPINGWSFYRSAAKRGSFIFSMDQAYDFSPSSPVGFPYTLTSPGGLDKRTYTPHKDRTGQAAGVVVIRTDGSGLWVPRSECAVIYNPDMNYSTMLYPSGHIWRGNIWPSVPARVNSSIWVPTGDKTWTNVPIDGATWGMAFWP